VKHLTIYGVAAIVAASLYTFPSRAQDRLAFEVASVKLSSGRPSLGLPRPMPGGQGYIVINSPLMIMLMSAYRITDSQVLGAPDWMFLNPTWDVEAKAEHRSILIGGSCNALICSW
jgi:hypothetical protein